MIYDVPCPKDVTPQSPRRYVELTYSEGTRRLPPGACTQNLCRTPYKPQSTTAVTSPIKGCLLMYGLLKGLRGTLWWNPKFDTAVFSGLLDSAQILSHVLAICTSLYPDIFMYVQITDVCTDYICRVAHRPIDPPYLSTPPTCRPPLPVDPPYLSTPPTCRPPLPVDPPTCRPPKNLKLHSRHSWKTS